MERVKGLHKKTTASSFGPLVPIGTDGTLVDMLSGLDNEQELKLGGNHVTEISEDDYNMIASFLDGDGKNG